MIGEISLRPATAAKVKPHWSDTTRGLCLATLFDGFAAGAAGRDVARTPIHAEVKALKSRGFGALRLGERPVSLPDLFRVVRDLATADPNIAHVFRNHFFAVETHRRTPQDPFSARVLDLARQGAMFGVAFSESLTAPAGAPDQTPATVLEWQGDGHVLSGRKVYSTGNLYADWLLGSALDSRDGAPRQFLVATGAKGVSLDDDWDGFGQKLTGSGTTVFARVRLAEADSQPLPRPAPEAPFLHGFTFHQIYLTTAISGVVNRIFRDALDLVRGRGRNFYHALADHPRDEPELQAAVGRIAAWRSAIEAVTERAALALDAAWAGAGGPGAEALSRAATLAAAEAKVVADETAASLAGLLIDLGSGSGVTVTRALDRHWRNIKVIAAHNPRLYKERILGDHYLNGSALPTGAFF